MNTAVYCSVSVSHLFFFFYNIDTDLLDTIVRLIIKGLPGIMTACLSITYETIALSLDQTAFALGGQSDKVKLFFAVFFPAAHLPFVV